MNKIILLTGAALLATGTAAFAQDAPAGTEPDATTAPDATQPGTTPDTTVPSAPAGTMTDPTTPGMTESTPTDMTGAPADTTTSTTPTDPTAPADASAAAVDPAKAQAASATVQADWAKYDTGNKGSLTPLEFGKWVLAASGNDMSAQVEKTRQSKASDLPAVKVLNATAAQFSKADTDKDRAISPAELTAFLGA